MEPSSQPYVAMGAAAEGSQVQPASAYPSAATIAPATANGSPGSHALPPFLVDPAQGSSQHQHAYQQQVHQQLQQFWAERMADIEENTNVKKHNLPLARIKKIMKADQDVQMISAEAPAVFAKACELFTMELTRRAWMHAEEDKRRVLQKSDIAAAITKTDIYDFLLDVIPENNMKQYGVGLPGAGVPLGEGQADWYPYYHYYMPQEQMADAGMVHGDQQGYPTSYTMLQEPNEQQEHHGTEEQQPHEQQEQQGTQEQQPQRGSD